MPKRIIRRRPRDYRSIARVAILVGVIVSYAGYWILTPSSVDVPRIEASASEYNVLVVTLHNPTYKPVTGAIVRIDTEQDVPNGHGGTTVLQSVPAEYPFSLLPQGSQTLDIPFVFRVFPGISYDIHMRIDGGGQQTISVDLPKS